jgi:lipoprotein Spr
MAQKLFCFFLLISFVGCGVVKKKTTYGKERSVIVEASDKEASSAEDLAEEKGEEPIPEKANEIINTALTYSGVRYKYGGTTKKGMDCSGLLYVSFKEHDVVLPRISYEMVEEGKRVNIKQVVKGDLLFFKTSKKGKKINHVGMVVAVEGDDIKFIHATTSRGVIVSSLHEGFWNHTFVKATRIL